MPRLLGTRPPDQPPDPPASPTDESSFGPPSPPPILSTNEPLISSEEAPGGLSCPICSESMVTLTQLNQHLDDEHTTKKSLTVGNPTPARRKVLSSSHISRKHWQAIAPGQVCSTADCYAAVERNGVHCRECGLVYCRPHSVYAKKLDENAMPDPENGIWARVCRGCFELRPGFSDNSGFSRDLTFSFRKDRQKHLDSHALVVERLEKRIVKLIVGLDNMDKEKGLFSFKDVQKKRDFETKVAPWENEELVTHCRHCNQRFSYFLRKHHCRSCGLVVCADMDRDCSRDVAISILAEKLERSDLATSSMYAVRICRDCKDSVFGLKNFRKEVESPLPELLQLQVHLKRKQAQIDLLMPRFQDLIGKLAEGDTDPGVVNESTTIRQQLLGSFSQFDNLARRLRNLPVDTETETALKKQMSAWAMNYLQDTMVPLQALPQVLQKEEPRIPKSQVVGLQNQIVVLEEQKFMVGEMLKSAKMRRRLDEVGPLELSLSELEKEINTLRDRLGPRDSF